MNTHYDQKLKPLNQAEIRDIVGSNAYYGGSLDMQSGHIHPLKFCLGLAKLATKSGARIFDILANLPAQPFPGGGARMRNSLLVALMLWYGLRDRF